MLQEIYIKNFVLIDELRLEFNRGLNALTGETGAGKSIIIDALGLVMGERVNNDYIRDSSRKAVAEAVFNLSDNQEAFNFLLDKGLLDEDDESTMIISREITPSRKSSARINGRNVTASLLKDLAPYLVDMHLQHDHLTILRPEMYLSYVDSFSTESGLLLPTISQLFNELKQKKQQLKQLQDSENDKLQRMDFLDFQIKEIEQAHLQPGEEEELSALRTRIRNAQNLLEGSVRLLQLLYSGEQGASAYDQLAEAVNIIGNLNDDIFIKSLQTPLEEMYFTLEDIAANLSSFRDSLDFQPGHLDEVEDRLHEINKLKSKYGSSIEEILQYGQRAEKEREKLERSQESQQELQQEIEAMQKEYFHQASSLTRVRKKAAVCLQDKVNQELLQLNMPHIQFQIVIESGEIPGINGIDKVEFLFSPNPGEEMRPLSKVASGGELSRFVLALKKALAEVYQVPTLIFDEIDVGVGGTALSAMAQKLSELSSSHQVILVTHAPQVASYAHQHFLIEKIVKDGRTYTRVKQLDAEARVGEIARMLAGENYSKVTLAHARDMLEQAEVPRGR